MMRLLASALTTSLLPSSLQQCGMLGAPWVGQDCTRNCPMKGGAPSGLFTMHPTGADGGFNMSIQIRHGPNGAVGKVLPGGKVQLAIVKGNATIGSCEGLLNPSCTNLTWTSSINNNRTTKGCFGAPYWCRAWTPGCESPEPPYGQGFAFLSSQGSNMVLQQAPAKSAVYGIVVGKASQVKVTVTDEGKGTSYEVDAKFNITQQPFGPEYVGGEAGYATAGAYIGGPHQTWKAYLHPATAGGNYTITAVCTGCYADADTPYKSINISNVTFGDVWHCSGQSNSKCGGVSSASGPVAARDCGLLADR
jgi:hypothetical protein